MSGLNAAQELHEIALLAGAWLRGEVPPATQIPPTAQEPATAASRPSQTTQDQQPVQQSADMIGERTRALESLRLSFSDCRRCAIATQRHTLVFGQGNPQARLMLIGEGPGEQEDLHGIAFCGPSGELLTKMLAAIQISREEVYIANIIKCRPPQNRNPLPEEVANCRGYLDAQIDIIKPALIATLGSVAIKTLVSGTEGVMRLRGQTLSYRGIPVVPTFHPSFLLREPSRKRDAWEDLKRIRGILDSQTDALR